jgi:hypothetical protein
MNVELERIWEEAGELRKTVNSSRSRYVRFQVLTAAGMMFRAVFWDILPCKMMSTDVSEVRTASIIRDEYAPLKRRSTIILHGSISQKTILNKIKIVGFGAQNRIPGLRIAIVVLSSDAV